MLTAATPARSATAAAAAMILSLLSGVRRVIFLFLRTYACKATLGTGPYNRKSRIKRIKPRSIVMRTPQSHTALENPPSQSTLEELRMPAQAKLTAAWTSLMFFVIYIDYFHLYKPGAIDQIRGGRIFEFEISGTLLTIFVVVIGIPALMIMLSMTLPARVSRATNLVVA